MAFTWSNLTIETLEQGVKYVNKKLIAKAQEGRHLHRSGVFIVNFEHISHLVLVFLLLTLSKQMSKVINIIVYYFYFQKQDYIDFFNHHTSSWKWMRSLSWKKLFDKNSEKTVECKFHNFHVQEPIYVSLGNNAVMSFSGHTNKIHSLRSRFGRTKTISESVNLRHF